MSLSATAETSPDTFKLNRNSPRTSPFLLAAAFIAVLLIWSFNYVVGKIALRHIDAWSLASMRLPLAAFLMLPVYFARIIQTKRASRTAIQRRDLWTFTYLGFFGVTINMGCYALGLSHTTSQHAVIVMALGPVLVLLLASALGVAKLTPAKGIGMAICFAGIIALESDHGVSRDSPLLIGDLITFMSISGFSLFTVFAKRIAMRYDAVSMNTYYVISGALSDSSAMGKCRMGWLGGNVLHGRGQHRRPTPSSTGCCGAWILRALRPSITSSR